MEYAQLNEDGTYGYQITTSGNVEWDKKNYCPAAALIKDGKAEQFRVVELHETEPPTIDLITQSVMRDGGEFVDGRWQYKWRVDALSDEQIAANQAMAVNTLIAEITGAVQKRLDDFSNARRYDDVNSMAKYKDLSDAEIQSLDDKLRPIVERYRSECKYVGLKVAETWARLEVIMADVQSEKRPMPSGYADIAPELPVLEWPA